MKLEGRMSGLLTQTILVLTLVIDCISGALYTAECNVAVNSNIDASLSDQVVGTVRFSQDGTADTMITINLSGFATNDANTKHGFHIHETNNLTVGCNSLGGHYNPDGVNHGGPSATTRHVGDLGNVLESGAGTVATSMTASKVKLTGAQSVIGRSIVVHSGEDDLGLVDNPGSRATGNAGSRLSCCIITDTTAGSGVAKHSPVVPTLLLSAIISVLFRLA